MALTYHNGALLEGHLPVSILWYGQFSPAQKSIVADFLLSLDPHDQPENLSSKKTLSLAVVENYPNLLEKGWQKRDPN